MHTPSRSLCFVAGEPSGDLQGSLLVEAIHRRHPDWRLWGVGSARMAQSGCDLWQDSRDWAVMGFAEVLRALPAFRHRLTRLRAEIARRTPDGVILIDYPGFNLRLAQRLHPAGVRTLYYIVPQIWAWGQGRIDTFRRHIDRTIVVFPFEQKFFAGHGVATDWVGHPFVDWVKPSAPRAELRARLGIAPTDKLVALLPGARSQDFRSHWPLFTEAITLLAEAVPDVRWGLGVASDFAADVAELVVRHRPLPVTTAVYDLMTAADVVLTKTGTATVECALIGTPMVCVYRTGTINFAIARRLVRVPYIAMPNLIAGRKIVPELIQTQATPETVAGELETLIVDPEIARRQREALAEVRSCLGPPGAVGRAVDIIEDWLGAEPFPR